jgi:predicted secreted hydrolase
MTFHRCGVFQSVAALLISSTFLLADEGEFARAVEPRAFEFPRDYGSHPEYKTEWWYLTGVLKTEAGELLGYQATWFRSALVPNAASRRSTLATRDLFFFHGAISDAKAGHFAFDQATSRGASSWAGVDNEPLRVYLFGHSLERSGNGQWRVRFTVQEQKVDLRLTPKRPPLLHGAQPGLSRKGPNLGQASYYFSHSRLQTVGTIQREDSATTVPVTGTSWLDREFGSNQLSEDQVGWDWFSVALDDGTDLMLYRMRKKDGTVAPESAGTLRFSDGRRAHLKKGDFRVQTLKHWQSPESGAKYPSRWQLNVPGHQVDLAVQPLIADQELRTRSSTGVTYWEGICSFQGTVGGQPVGGHGYVELVGYAGPFVQGI